MPRSSRNPHHWSVVVSAFVLAAAVTVTASVKAHGGAAQGAASPSASPTKSKPSGTVLQFGLDYSDTLPWMSASRRDTALDDAVHAGAKWIRVDLAWEDYQSTSAAFAPDFSRFDPVVQAANDRGLKILATIDHPPVWARSSECSSNPSCHPASFSEYAQFAQDAANHLAPMGVHTWEIWNEPNIPSWAPQPDPSAYGDMLAKTANAIHAADSGAVVMMGGLAVERPHPGIPFIPGPDFVTAVAATGALKDINAVAYHPYPGQPDVATAQAFQTIARSPDNLVAALDRAGFPKMPIWVTETGFSVPAVAMTNATALMNQELQQQVQVVTNMVPFLAQTPHVQAMFWFNDQDVPSSRLFYGLRTADGTVRPVLAALHKAIAANEGS